MKYFRFLITLLLINIFCGQAFSQELNVNIKMRGNTGLEEAVKGALSKELGSFSNVVVTEDRSICHLYLDLTLVEQKPIRFYGLGICIAYHIQEEMYSRPTSDVAQFGEERIGEVCRFLAKQINKGFLDPLRTKNQ